MAIIRQAECGLLYTRLHPVDFLKDEGSWPPPTERVLPFQHSLIGPWRRSHTEYSPQIEPSFVE
jgi:hypothetical protein